MKRISRIEDQQAAQPISPVHIEAAYEHFVKTGELPTCRRLAATITQRALHQSGEGEGLSDVERYYKEVGAIFSYEGPDDGDKLRRQLFGEAVNGGELIQHAARGFLKVLAGIGIDLTEPLPFDRDTDYPAFGSLGLHLLGWPKCLIRPPYEERATKLLARLDVVRQRLHDLPDWEKQFDDAVAGAYVTGALPENATMREAVTCNRELHELMSDLVEADNDHIC